MTKLDKKLEVAPDGSVEPVAEVVSYQVVDSPGFVKELGATWGECIANIEKPEYRKKLLTVKQQMRDVELMALGYSPTMVDLGRATNEQALVPAVDKLLGSETYLKHEVRGLVQDVPFGQIRETRDYYGFVLGLQEGNDGYAKGIEVLRTHAGQHMGGWTRRVYTRLSGAAGLHAGLGEALGELGTFAAGPAQQGAQTRRDNEQLTEKVEKATLDKAAAQPAAQPQPAAPVTVAVGPQPVPAAPPPATPLRQKGRV